MLTKRLKPGQLFTANGKVFRVRNTSLEKENSKRLGDECDECRKVNGTWCCHDDSRCIAYKGKFLCSTVCGYGHYPQFIRNAK